MGPHSKPAEESRLRSGGAPAGGARYTPRGSRVRVRPRWHRLMGWLGVVLGASLAIANDSMLIIEDVTLLPFGHHELYLVLGVLVVGAFSWFLGVFDRGTTIYT